jgi:hypothetical protein
MTDQASHVFDLLSERGVAKSVLRRRFREDSCINSTRVLFDVFRAVGIAAQAVSVRTRIYSPGFVNRAYRAGRMPESSEEVHSWTAAAGVWSVGIGYGIDQGKQKWPGHLVLRSDDHLIDATIDQANRPQHGIVMPPMLMLARVPDAFWRAENLLGVEVNGAQVVYEARPHDTSYVGSPAWSGRSHIEGAIAAELVCYLDSKGVRCVPAATAQIGTQIRQHAISEAISALRQRIGWTQEEFSVAIHKHLGKASANRSITWGCQTISKWEHGTERPSHNQRMALARIACQYGHKDLASVFRQDGGRATERP